MDSTFIQARITSTQALIVAYETAIDAITTGGMESYTLDTGQSRQTVSLLNLKDLQNTLDALYNRCATLEARLNGASIISRPAW